MVSMGWWTLGVSYLGPGLIVDRIRTGYPRITSPLLYQVSYHLPAIWSRTRRLMPHVSFTLTVFPLDYARIFWSGQKDSNLRLSVGLRDTLIVPARVILKLAGII